MPYAHRKDFPAPPKGKNFLYQSFSREEWQGSDFARREDIEWFRDASYGMFIHFGLSAYKNEDLSWGVCGTRKAPDVGRGPYADSEWTQWHQHFNLEAFDAKQWVDIAIKSGFKYLVIVTKHHDGFHMWDTAESEYKITNTPFGRDFVKELVDACHEVELPIGLYYSQRDWTHPDYMPVDPEKIKDQEGVSWTLKSGYDQPMGEKHHLYLEYQERAIRELCTKYGKIDIFWWDAAWWGGMFTAEMWDATRINRLIREWQPGILINNRCSIPGDFDTPEKRLGAFQDWRPWESCVCLTDTWSYSATSPKKLDELVVMLIKTVCGDGNLLLSWGAQWSGEFDSHEIKALNDMGAWLKTYGTSVYGTRGGPWKPGRWGGAVYRDQKIYLHILGLSGESLRLPLLPSGRILGAKVFGQREQLVFKMNESEIEWRIPKHLQDQMDTIVELDIDIPVASIPTVAVGENSIFEDIVAYGYPLEGDFSVQTQEKTTPMQGSSFAEPLRTKYQANPWMMIDLGSCCCLTGMALELSVPKPTSSAIRLATSVDGINWQKVGDIQAGALEVEVTSCDAGAYIPGRAARFIHISELSQEPTELSLEHLTVYAKGARS